jgi:hypothetical protein
MVVSELKKPEPKVFMRSWCSVTSEYIALLFLSKFIQTVSQNRILQYVCFQPVL